MVEDKGAEKGAYKQFVPAEGEPLYPTEKSHPHGGIEAFHPVARVPHEEPVAAEPPVEFGKFVVEPKRRVSRRASQSTSSQDTTSPAWKRPGKRTAETPTRRVEKGWMKRRIERYQMGVGVVEVRPYPIVNDHPSVEVYTPINDPRFKRLDWVKNCAILAIKPGRSNKGSERPRGWTDAFVVDRIGQEDEILKPRTFDDGYGMTDLISVRWNQIRVKKAPPKPTA